MTRFIILSSILLTLCLDLFSQPNINWKKCYGGTSADGFRKIALSNSNEVFFIGSTRSNDGNVSGNHGANDFWVGKIDVNGTLLWQKCLGGTLADYGTTIDICQDGGIVVAGETSSNDGDVSGLIGSSDFWIVKMDSLGNIEWQKCLGGTSGETPLALKQTPDNGYIIAGMTYSNDGNVSGNHGDYDSWIVKLDSMGNNEWQKCLGGSGEDWANDICLVNDGYVVLSYAESNDGDIIGNHGEHDYWIVKLNFSGNIIWQKCYGGSYNDMGQSIISTSDNGIIAVGMSNSNDGDVSNNTGDDDYWLIKLDSSGTLEWEKCFGYDLNFYTDHGQSVYQTNDTGFIIAGFSCAFPPYSTCHHDWDLWLVKINSAGILEWEKCLGGSDKDYCNSVFQDLFGNYYIAGETFSNDGDFIGNHGWVDSWLIKLGNLTNIETQEMNNEYVLYPNPTSSQITIKLNRPCQKPIDFYLYNNGILVRNVKVKHKDQIDLNVEDLEKGLYLFKILSSDHRIVGKLIVK